MIRIVVYVSRIHRTLPMLPLYRRTQCPGSHGGSSPGMCIWNGSRTCGQPYSSSVFVFLSKEDMMLKRPKPRSLMMAFSFLALLILVLSACGAPTPGTPPPGGGTAVKGGTWIDDLYEEPDSLITNASSETFSDMVDQGLYAPLFV